MIKQEKTIKTNEETSKSKLIRERRVKICFIFDCDVSTLI